ncbi:MAG: RNA 2',3'-cyclic phosphodiesterase [Candidatus Thorarchaeota archaeon]
MKNGVRAFICVKIDDDNILDAVMSIQQKLDRHAAKVKFVKRDNLHFTLRFLGDTQMPMLDRIRVTLSEFRFDCFRVSIGGVGVFPNTRRPRIVWVGVKSNGERITQLKREIDKMLTVVGYAPEKRFTPHATIARVRRVMDPPAMESNINQLVGEVLGNMDVVSFKMMKSTLTPSGPIYSQLWEVCCS